MAYIKWAVGGDADDGDESKSKKTMLATDKTTIEVERFAAKKIMRASRAMALALYSIENGEIASAFIKLSTSGNTGVHRKCTYSDKYRPIKYPAEYRRAIVRQSASRRHQARRSVRAMAHRRGGLSICLFCRPRTRRRHRRCAARRRRRRARVWSSISRPLPPVSARL